MRVGDTHSPSLALNVLVHGAYQKRTQRRARPQHGQCFPGIGVRLFRVLLILKLEYLVDVVMPSHRTICM